MLDAGNKVVFQKGNTYIENKSGRLRTPIDEINGAFVFDLWMLKDSCCNNQRRTRNTGRFQALTGDGAKGNSGFARQAGLKW